jgi:hypothetical protein
MRDMDASTLRTAGESGATAMAHYAICDTSREETLNRRQQCGGGSVVLL